MFDFDFLMADNPDTTANFTGDSGLNIAMDGAHDWADGGGAQLPDLFGGFFFGGPAGDGAGMDMAEGFPAAAGEFGDGNVTGMTSRWDGNLEGS